jgi:FixJ family two-component response regulator
VSANKIHVAVVDDDEGFLRAISRLLRAAGFEAVAYPSAEAFLADTTHAPHDCALLDIHLGGMSGLDLCRRLAAQRSALPVIFITAHDDPGTHKEAEAVGYSAYLRKPVPRKVLIEAINKAVRPETAAAAGTQL